ncbi:hypothetical protein [Derxia lacustris]|uniref:hypothetical protein n=1 Tax=Derxia lacustris TaxID=764842 RepID=UPI000A171A56|nr:hypothetical protein [Derxia lacustris]
MPGFVLCHGWGLDARSLDPLAAALRARFPAHELLAEELGFFGPARAAVADAAARDDGGWIGIGHSWGFARLAQATVAPRWRALVSINGFTRFCRAPGRRSGMPARAVDAMLARLALDADGCLADFHARCAEGGAVPAAVPPYRADSAALAEALRQLRDSDFVPPAVPLLALVAAADAVVAPEHAQTLFAPLATELVTLAGSHLLPLDAPDDCAAAIARFVAALPPATE